MITILFYGNYAILFYGLIYILFLDNVMGIKATFVLNEKVFSQAKQLVEEDLQNL